MFIMLVNSRRALCSAVKSQMRICVEPFLLNVLRSFNNQLITNIYCLHIMCQTRSEALQVV